VGRIGARPSLLARRWTIGFGPLVRWPGYQVRVELDGGMAAMRWRMCRWSGCWFAD